MALWMKVTSDKYELPLIVEDSCHKLAERCGVQSQSISKAIWNAKRHGGRCEYVKILEDKDD